MPRPLCIISDVHGSHLTLLALLLKVRAVYPDVELYLLGDLIDRGPRSKEVVEFAIKHKVPTCGGNHEDLCVDYHLNQLTGERSSYEHNIWYRNGGLDTRKSFGGKISTYVVDWMSKLPLHIIPPDYPDLLLSHTGHGLITPESQHTSFDAIWSRSFRFPKDGYYRVFGHSVQPEPIVTETYACIDTGCAYGGRLTALVWPTRELFSHPNID